MVRDKGNDRDYAYRLPTNMGTWQERALLQLRTVKALYYVYVFQTSD